MSIDHELDTPVLDVPAAATGQLARPFRLGVVGLGVAFGLFTRMLVANGFGELISRRMVLAAAVTSAAVGLGNRSRTRPVRRTTGLDDCGHCGRLGNPQLDESTL